MSGGPSHLELFDPKPDLQRLHGQPLPESFGPVATRRNVARNRLLATRHTFRRCGQSGVEVSDLLPHLARHADDLCVIRSCHGDSVTHPESVYLLNTGSILMGRPSLGSWVSYGLGTENQNMPAYVVLPDPAGLVKGGAPRGATAICRPRIRAPCCAAVVHRCRTCTTRPASAAPSSSARSTSLTG